jgi:hypothetical protein
LALYYLRKSSGSSETISKQIKSHGNLNLPKNKKFSKKLVKMSEENDNQNSSLSENSSDDDESKEAGPSVAVNPFFDKSKRQKLKSEKSENSEKDSDSDFSDSSDDEDSDLSEKEDSDGKY